MMKTKAGSFNEYAADIFAQLGQARYPTLCQISYFNNYYPFSILHNPSIDQIRMLLSAWIIRMVLISCPAKYFYFMTAMDQRLRITTISIVKKHCAPTMIIAVILSFFKVLAEEHQELYLL